MKHFTQEDWENGFENLRAELRANRMNPDSATANFMVRHALTGDTEWTRQFALTVAKKMLLGDEITIEERYFTYLVCARIYAHPDLAAVVATNGKKVGRPRQVSRAFMLAAYTAGWLIGGRATSVDEAWTAVASANNTSPETVKKSWTRWRKKLDQLAAAGGMDLAEKIKQGQLEARAREGKK